MTKQRIQSFTEKGANFKLTNKNKLTDGAWFISKNFVYCFTTEIDMSEMLKLSFALVPLCLVHINGSTQKDPKS